MSDTGLCLAGLPLLGRGALPRQADRVRGWGHGARDPALAEEGQDLAGE
jgi:hypothetical protein